MERGFGSLKLRGGKGAQVLSIRRGKNTKKLFLSRREGWVDFIWGGKLTNFPLGGKKREGYRKGAEKGSKEQ